MLCGLKRERVVEDFNPTLSCCCYYHYTRLHTAQRRVFMYVSWVKQTQQFILFMIKSCVCSHGRKKSTELTTDVQPCLSVCTAITGKACTHTRTHTPCTPLHPHTTNLHSESSLREKTCLHLICSTEKPNKCRLQTEQLCSHSFYLIFSVCHTCFLIHAHSERCKQERAHRQDLGSRCTLTLLWAFSTVM